MKNYAKSGESSLANIVHIQGKNFYKVNQVGSSFKLIEEEEKSTLTRIINTLLSGDIYLHKIIPINPDNCFFFIALRDGIILCKLINLVQQIIDERVMIIKETHHISEWTQNLNLAINSSKVIGCTVLGINSNTIIEQKHTLVLGLVWQIIKNVFTKDITLKKYPQLIRLLKEGEMAGDLLKISKDDLMLRWFNYHLTKACHTDLLNHFSQELSNSVKFIILLNQLDNIKCDKSALDESDLKIRAQKMLDCSKKLGVNTYFTQNDILSGNCKIYSLFTTAIFNNCHGFEKTSDIEAKEAIRILNDDVEGTREENAFRDWINSLGIEKVHVYNLYEDVKDGLILLRILDWIKFGSVDWKKIDKLPKNTFKKLANCNEVIDASKKCGFSIVGIGGSDIHQGNKKLILAIVWQMIRYHTLKILGDKTEEDLIKWVNETADREVKITSFRDKSLRNSLTFLNIINLIDANAIKWDLVIKDKDDNDSLEKNAKYAISVSRKLGASVFLIWEDIKEVTFNLL